MLNHKLHSIQLLLFLLYPALSLLSSSNTGHCYWLYNMLVPFVVLVALGATCSSLPVTEESENKVLLIYIYVHKIN